MELLDERQNWHTFYGRQIPLEQLSHQHLSNIIWYWEIIFKSRINQAVYDQIEKRFGGQKLPYRPLISFTNEIDTLFAMGYITSKLNSDIIVDGKWIGKIAYD
jgi:hypothetical protein